jgi:protein-ribulosamine 3-kinase
MFGDGMIPLSIYLKEALARAFVLHPELEDSDGRRVGEPRAVGGGCVNNASVVSIGGDSFFLKRNAKSPEGMFLAEASGLEALRAPGALRYPRPFAVGAPEFEEEKVAEGVALVPCAEPFLLMEYLPKGRPAPDYGERLGAGLAAQHRTTAERFGFAIDNFIGATPQPNGWLGDWVEFFAERRLEHQAKLAREKGLAESGMVRAIDRLTHKLDGLLGDPPEPPALLHGDLWGGNHHAGADGAPVLFDPAPYFGRREADIAMTELFGGFDEAFLETYRAEWPLAEGYPERRDVYNLYHLLNHLNLFGASYAGQVSAILRRHAG